MKLKTVEIGLLGQSKTGKTSLARLFASNGACFSRDYHLTSGVEVFTKILTKVNSEEGDLLLGSDQGELITEYELKDQAQHVKIKLFDFGGSEVYRNAIVFPVLQKLNKFFFVFDLSNPESFEQLSVWRETLRKKVPGPCQLVVLGNKKDLKGRQVDSQTAENWAKAQGAKYVETSALEYGEVDQVFKEIILGLDNE